MQKILWKIKYYPNYFAHLFMYKYAYIQTKFTKEPNTCFEDVHLSHFLSDH